MENKQKHRDPALYIVGNPERADEIRHVIEDEWGRGMRNMYFNGDIHGVTMITDLECHCLTKQRIKFCKNNHIPISYAKNQTLMKSYGFKSQNTNPKGCEGERENRVYYSWNGCVNFTQSPFKKFIVRMLFKKMEYKED